MKTEFLKMRRLKLGVVSGVIAVGTLLFASMSTFSGTFPGKAADPSNTLWLQAVLQYTMVSALTGPLLASVLASRLADIEHHSNGWILNESAGVSRSVLVGRKFVVLIPVVILSQAFSLGTLIALHLLRGNRAPIPWGLLLWTYAAILVVTLVLLGLSLWLSSKVENQLLPVGVGVIGGFLGMFSLLLPPAFALITPWGYFAAGLRVQQVGSSLTEIEAPFLRMALFALIGCVLCIFLVRGLDREVKR